MENVQARANGLDFEHIGWKYYNTIRKKAMEQEFSWSGLFVSLSIAFFIVIMAAWLLSFAYATMGLDRVQGDIFRLKLYRLETTQTYSLDNYLQVELIGEAKVNDIRLLNLA